MGVVEGVCAGGVGIDAEGGRFVGGYDDDGDEDMVLEGMEMLGRREAGIVGYL